MANKQVKYSFGGINQDQSRSKHSFKYYFEGQHIRILATDTQSTGSVTNEKGNALVITVPSLTIEPSNSRIVVDFGAAAELQNSIIVYTTTEIQDQIDAGLLPLTSTTQKIIGIIDNRSGIIIFTSDGLGMDCVWLVDNVLSDNYSIQLLYLRNLGFSINSPIQAFFNYENTKIEKVYWVDGLNQIRFLNTRHSIANGDIEEIIDIPSNTINFVGNFDISEPTIENVVYGGTHTAGKIQYAYNLYRINGSQTTISPLTDLVALDVGPTLGGGDLNEVVGATPIVKVDNIDPAYTHIKLYAIKYTSLNQIPQVSLIEDREIGESNSITYFDDGEIIENLTLEQFIFLGSDPIVPKHIESKYSRLFSANIEENNFDVSLDCRAYSFLTSSTTAIVLNNVEIIVGSLGIPSPTPTVGGDFLYVNNLFTNIPDNYDAVNPNYDAYRFKKSSTIQGGTGKYITYNITPTILAIDDIVDGRFFKGNEIYRIGIQFYNRLGQVSFPKWIADFKAPFFDFDTTYNTLEITLTTEFDTWLADDNNFATEDDRPTGYKIIRANRGLNDRTILYQGVLSPMMFQVKGDEAQDFAQFNTIAGREVFQDSQSKLPSWALRNIIPTMSLQTELGVNINPDIGRIASADHLGWLTDQEIHSVTASSEKISQTFLFTKMLQFHSPDILFDFANTKNGLRLRVNGLIYKKEEFIRTKETFTVTELEKWGGKFEFYPTRQFHENNNMSLTFSTPGGTIPRYIGPSGASDTTDIFQMYRSYKDFYENTDSDTYTIYAIPEVTEEGQEETNYNGDDRYRYSNNLSSFASDGEDSCSDNNCDALVSINSNAIKSLTLMLGTQGQTTNSRLGLVGLYNGSTIAAPDGDGVLSIDITIPNVNVYLGNIYGGGTFEDKKRNTYAQIGQYKDILISGNVNTINSPGDTFVNSYQFMRIGKTSTNTLDTKIPQITEIISFPVETVVDLKNRNDLGLFGWDGTFQPEFNDYHNYNRVYSQSPNLILNTGEGAIFKEINEFDTRVYASKVKIPGENIDSWTDLLINESQDLDGKYGPINGLINFKDNLFVFQDEAIAVLSIDPRIQVQGSDGVAVELGRGAVFYDYKYLTTTSGSINKWGILPTKKGIYYYDALNKAVGRVPDAVEPFLTDAKGLHVYFNNNFDYDLLKVDNPLLRSGVVFGYDNYNNDIYFTLLQGDKSFTRVYNELIDEFIDKKTYTPSGYIYKGEKFLLTDSGNAKIYEHYKGDYNKYFGEFQPSFITLMINPESDYDCVFDNILFNSELYIDDIDHPDKTITHITASSEYQNSGKIPLVVGRDRNLRRKFREWKANIPRDGRNRIRNPWIFLQLELDTQSKAKLILHDIIINYTV